MIVPLKEILLKDETQITLRSVRTEEAAAMLEHLVISHSESYQNLNRSPEFWKTMSLIDEEKILANMQSSPKKFMMGAFAGTKLIAGLGIFGNDDQVFTNRTALLGISIQEKFHGLGLGTQMMKYSFELAKGMGLHRIELSVRTYNQTGIALYERLGFRKVGTLTECSYIDG